MTCAATSTAMTRLLGFLTLSGLLAASHTDKPTRSKGQFAQEAHEAIVTEGSRSAS